MGECSDPSALWTVTGEAASAILSALIPGIGLDVDCALTAPHTVVKALASSDALITFAARQLSVSSGAACFNTGQAGASEQAVLPERGLSRHANSARLCADASMRGWTLVPVACDAPAAVCRRWDRREAAAERTLFQLFRRILERSTPQQDGYAAGANSALS